jgi:hypothetical protein
MKGPYANIPRYDHEFLERKAPTSVRPIASHELHFDTDRTLKHIPSIKNIHERDGKDVRLLSSSKVRDMCIERYTLRQAQSVIGS